MVQISWHVHSGECSWRCPRDLANINALCCSGGGGAGSGARGLSRQGEAGNRTARDTSQLYFVLDKSQYLIIIFKKYNHDH